MGDARQPDEKCALGRSYALDKSYEIGEALVALNSTPEYHTISSSMHAMHLPGVPLCLEYSSQR